MGEMVPLAFILTYTVIGAVAFNRWTRSLRRHHPRDLKGDPAGWLRYWFLHLVAAELFALVGTGIMWALIVSTNPWLRAPDAAYSRAGAVLGLVLFSALFIAFDIVVFVRARRMARARR